jgi:hypothetical protein
MSHFIEPLQRHVMAFYHLQRIPVDFIERRLNFLKADFQLIFYPVDGNAFVLNKLKVGYFNIDHLPAEDQ